MASRKVINSPADVTAKTILAAAIGSGAATNGQALEADGAGGASWQSLSGTPTLDAVLSVSNITNHDIVPNTDNHDSLGSITNRFLAIFARGIALYKASIGSFMSFWDLSPGQIGSIDNISGDLAISANASLLLNSPNASLKTIIPNADVTTSASIGGASALPGLPQKYITVVVNAVTYKIPLYLP